MKKKLVLFFLVILFFVGSSLFLDFRYDILYGDKYKVSNPTMMYWYPEDKVDNVSYYLFKRGDILYCEYENEDKKYYLCAWKFSIFRDPLFGWVKIKDLEKR